LRERLANRARPVGKARLLIDHEAADTAERAVRQARNELQIVLLATSEDERVQPLRDRLDAAQAALDACYELIVCTGLPEVEYEALLGAHPPREGNDDDETWNSDTFPRACFLACAPPDGGVAEWEEFLATQTNEAERIILYNAAIKANVRAPDPSVPKG
jgi:hypothetical protein